MRPALTDILIIIGRLAFRVAKTMPRIPHEYTVRSVATEADYVTLFNAITRDGHPECYNGRKRKYLYPGDGWKYWAMTTFLPESKVINRTRIEDALPGGIAKSGGNHSAAPSFRLRQRR